MRKFIACFSKFARAQNGVAALEFALLLPLLLVMLLGSVELQRYMRIDRQLALAAENIAAAMAQRPPSEDKSVSFEFDALPHLFPPSQDGELPWYSTVAHQITNVIFSPTTAGCTQNCTYKADVHWRWPFWQTAFGLGGMWRFCGPLAPQPEGNGPSGGTLPAALFGPGSVVVVDLGYQYKPLFGSNLLPPMTIFKQGYASPRFAPLPFPKNNPHGGTTGCQI